MAVPSLLLLVSGILISYPSTLFGVSCRCTCFSADSFLWLCFLVNQFWFCSCFSPHTRWGSLDVGRGATPSSPSTPSSSGYSSYSSAAPGVLFLQLVEAVCFKRCAQYRGLRMAQDAPGHAWSRTLSRAPDAVCHTWTRKKIRIDARKTA